MNKYRFSNIFCVAFTVLMLTCFSSCGDDDVQGCTDPLAENFDALANVDNGSCVYAIDEVLGCMDSQAENFDPLANVDSGACVYARDKFFGEYEGSFLCTNDITKGFLSSDSLRFTVSPSLEDDDKSAVLFGLTIEGFPIDLNASITGNTITINDTFPDFTIPVESLGNLRGDIIGLGSATLSTDNSMLNGDLRLTILLLEDVNVGGATLFSEGDEIIDNCDLNAIRI